MADLAALRKNPDFLALKPEDQQAILDEASAPPAPGLIAQGEDALQGLMSSVTSPEGRADIASGAGAGVRGSIAGLDALAANTAMLARRAGESLPPIAGGGRDTTASRALTSVEQTYRERAARTMAEAVAGRRAGVAPTVAEIVSGLPIGLMTAAAATEVGGPVAGFAGLGAVGAADQGPEAAATEGLKGAVLGGIFKGTERFSPLVKGPIIGAATYKLSGETDPTRRATEALAFGGLSAMGGRRAAERKPEDVATRAELDQIAGEPVAAPAPPATETGGPPAEPVPPEAMASVPAAPESAPLTPEQTRAAFAAKIGPQPQPPTASNLGDRVRQSLADDTHGFLMSERIGSGGPVPDGGWESVRRLRAVPEIMDKSEKWGAPHFVEDMTAKVAPGEPRPKMVRFGKDVRPGAEGEGWGKAFDELLTKVPSTEKPQYLQDSWTYLAGKQSEELMAQGREKLFTPQEIRAFLAFETPERKTWYAKLKRDGQQIGDFMQAGGLVNSKQRAAWDRNEFVISYWRDFTGDLSRGGGPGSPGSKPIYHLKGSARNLRDPMESFLGGRARRVQLTLENQAKLAALREGRKAGLVEDVPSDPKMASVRREAAIRQVMEPLEAAGDPAAVAAMKAALAADPSLPEMLQMFAGRQAPEGRDIVTSFVDGEVKYSRIKDPVLLRAFDQIRRSSLDVGAMIDWLNKARGLTQELVTANPPFVMKNLGRDAMTSAVMSQTGSHLTAAARGLQSVIAQDANFRDFIANGGGGSQLRSPEQFKRQVLSAAAKRGLDPKRILILPVDVMNAMGRIGELGPRVGEYIKAREQGQTAGHSAFLGREITSDFAQRGDSPTMRLLSMVGPFFSASIASVDRDYRGIREPEQRARVAVKIGMMASLALLLHAYNSQDPDYQKLPQWDKDGYFHIPLGPFAQAFGADNDPWLRLPNPWGLIGAASSVSKRMFDSLVGSPSVKDRSLAIDLGKIAADQFAFPVAAGVQPFVEQWANKVYYTGAPIVPDSVAERQTWDQSTSGTSPALRKLGRASRGTPFEFSPARAQALLRGLFSTYADLGLWAANSTVAPGQSNLNWDDNPLIGTFIERKGRYNRFRDEFYQVLDDTNAVMRSLSNATQGGDTQVEGELERNPLYDLEPELRSTAEEVSDIGKEIEHVSQGNLPTEEKRRRVNKLSRERDKLMEDAVNMANRAREKVR